MRRLHTTWNHPAKLKALLVFGVFCIFFFSFLTMLVCSPAMARCWVAYYAVAGLALVGGFCGYLAFFCSEEWFQARAAWWDKHRRLRLLMNVAGWLLFAFFMAKEIAEFLRHLNRP